MNHSNDLIYNDYSVSERQKRMNELIYLRNLPSSVLQPYISTRPVDTKRMVLPIVDPRVPSSSLIPLEQQAVFDVHRVFNPGTSKAPWSGFAVNIDIESELRGQVYALQRSEQGIHIPANNSMLYMQSIGPPMPTQTQGEPQLSTHHPVHPNIGYAVFNNSTRNQLRDT